MNAGSAARHQLALDHLGQTLGPRARSDVPLGPLTTYGVGGLAALLVEVADVAALATVAAAVSARTDADDGPVSTLVIGLGSNLLVADDGFAGLVVVLGSEFTAIDGASAIGTGTATGEGATIRAGARSKLPVVARQSAAAGLTGFEWASGVPGSVGGAVRMNAGVHESDLAEVLVRVHLVDLHSGEDGTVPAADLDLAYRSSSVQPHQVVTWAELALEPGDPDVGRAAIREKTLWRRQHQPGGRNAGSVFTNPPGDSAGRLIEAAGAKGLRIGSAEVSPKHANFIQVDDGGRAGDVVALMAEIRHRVLDDAGVALHAETCLVGFPETATEAEMATV